MSKPCKLILIVNDIQALQNVHWGRDEPNDFTLSLLIGEIRSIKLISENVLRVEFDTGKLLLDVTKDELTNIDYEE